MSELGKAVFLSYASQDAEVRFSAFAAIHRYDDALDLLKVEDLRVTGLSNLFMWDRYDPLRNEARFVKLLAEAGLTEAHARAQAWRKAHPPEKPAARK